MAIIFDGLLTMKRKRVRDGSMVCGLARYCPRSPKHRMIPTVIFSLKMRLPVEGVIKSTFHCQSIKLQVLLGPVHMYTLNSV